MKLAVGLSAVLVLATGCATSGHSGSDPVPSLAGTRWVVTRIDGVSAPRGLLGAEFSMDGRVMGNSGCNTFSGPFTQSDTGLQVGELLSTRRACVDRDRQNLETRMLDILQGQTSLRLVGEVLHVRGDTGSLELRPGAYQVSGLPRRVQFDCDGMPMTVVFEGASAALSWKQGSDVLQQQPAASGVWYESPRNMLRGEDALAWTSDGEARLCTTGASERLAASVQ